MKIKFEVFGKPMGKERHRDTWNGRKYTPPKTQTREDEIRWAYKQKYGNYRFPKGTCLELLVVAVFPIPKSAPKYKQKLMLSGEIRPDVKPDYDNIAKIVSDALNKVAYDDDKSIVDSTQRKFYGENPRTIIILQEAKPLERSQI